LHEANVARQFNGIFLEELKTKKRESFISISVLKLQLEPGSSRIHRSAAEGANFVGELKG
jgi:hypothetical protein